MSIQSRVVYRFGILLLSLICWMAKGDAAQSYSPEWHIIDADQKLLYGNDGELDLLVYTLESGILFGVPSSIPHLETLELIIDNKTSNLPLVQGDDISALYELTPKTLAALLHNESFNLKTKSGDIHVVSGELKKNYALMMGDESNYEREIAEYILAIDLSKILMKRMLIPKDKRSTLYLGFSSCVLDRIGDMSPELLDAYIDELNATQSVPLAQKRAMQRALEDGEATLDVSAFKQGFTKCVDNINDILNP